MTSHQTAEREDTAPSPATGRGRWTLLLTGIGFFVVILDALVVVTALPTIHADVGGNLASLQWILSAYLLAFGAGILPASTLGDKFGRRRLYAAGLAIFTAASAAGALAPSLETLILARVVQGLGAAFIAPLSLALLGSAFPPEHRGAMIGIWGAIGGAGIAAGPVVGGAVTEGLGWQWIFWINVPIGIVAVLLTLLKVPESRGADSHVDLLGVGLVSGAGVGLLWALVQGAVVGWASAQVLFSAVAGVGLLATFVLWESRAREPMMPLHLFRNRTFTSANAVGFLSQGAIFATATLVTEYFQTVLGYSPLDAGLRFLPWTAVPLLVAPYSGRLVDRIGARPVMVGGLLLELAGFSLFTLLAEPSTRYSLLLAPLFLTGLGVSLVLPSAPMAVLGSVAREDIGKASGTLNSFMRFGGAFVVALGTSVLAVDDAQGSAAGFLSGFRPAMEIMVLLTVVGVAFALAVRPPPVGATARASPGAPGSVRPAPAPAALEGI